MPTSNRIISINELTENLTQSRPTEGCITFPNGKRAVVGITPMRSWDIERKQKGSYALISMGENTPLWMDDPRLMDAQAAREVTEFDWLSFASNCNTIAGTGVGIADISGYRTTMRFARQNSTIFSPKFYPTGWTGGTRSRIITYKVVDIAGRTLFVVGILFDVSKNLSGEQSWTKTGVNTIFSTIMTFGGLPGFAIGAIYFGLDFLGVWDREPIAAPHRDIMVQSIDNLRISIPQLPIPAIKKIYQPKQTFIGPKPSKRY